MRYRTYASYLKDTYGEKVYKIPVNLPVTCPNRTCGGRGCTFCGDVGTGFEAQENTMGVKEQLNKNIEHISKKYNAKKYIAYFQNFSNTFMPLEEFKAYISESLVDGLVGISVSTRPDCIHPKYLDFLKEFGENHNLDISIELGLQSINPNTLERINRGHSLGEFIDAVLTIKPYGFEICTHLIVNLPWDTDLDFLESAKILSSLGIKHVKLHSLYILKNTVLGDQYENGEFEMISPEAYVDRIVDFIRMVPKDMVFQRIAGRAPKEDTLFCNWDMSWWRIKDMIDEALEARDIRQGEAFNYLGGKAVKKFIL